jgi:hypothetical protein
VISASGAGLSVSWESAMFGSVSMVGCRGARDVLYDLSSFIGWGGQAYRFGVDL